MGYALTTYQKESELPVIGFDMGGLFVLFFLHLCNVFISLLRSLFLVFVMPVISRNKK